MHKDKFPYTNTGYKSAMKWLKENNKEYLIQKEQSVDGYTIVALANSLNKRYEDGL